ncbi:MAG: hypothetical protein KGH78_03880, partial [Candidatus Micrarchaeota archaeon]|nr:hypothetical protein [Candidatus Micrarchaeota archaeon]
TSFGKIFTSIMAFISTGTVIFALGFIFGPFFGKLIRVSEREIRKEEKAIIRDVKKYERRR